MNKRDAENQRHMMNALESLGFDHDERAQLRRISMTLQRWHELECGTGDGQTSYSIERETEEPDSKPFMRVQYPTANGYVGRRYRVPDRETGARKRLAAIMAKHSEMTAYVQGDPRGAALYILRPGDVPADGAAESYYTRGICVY